MSISSTRLSQHVKAPQADVYHALRDAHAVATWMVPQGMTSHVHVFEPREGGSFRIALTYDTPTGTGKTTAHTDTYHGHFVKLVPNEQVVEVWKRVQAVIITSGIIGRPVATEPLSRLIFVYPCLVSSHH